MSHPTPTTKANNRTSPLTFWAPILLFAAALGHFIDGTVNPAFVPEYTIGGRVTALAAPDDSSRQVYLRRSFNLPDQPQHAWVRVVGRDQLRVYVNGKLVGSAAEDGFDAAVVTDVTNHLQPGVNCIAVSAAQTNAFRLPLASVEMGYSIDQQEFLIGADSEWRAGSTFQRRGHWWFEPEYDDAHWPAAARTECELNGRIKLPPRAVTAKPLGRWITSGELTEPVSCVRREFDLPFRPQSAWLRMTIDAHYRLAINGTVLDVQEEGLGVDGAVKAVERTYDLSPWLNRGSNVVALMISRGGARPFLRADLEARGGKDNIVAFGSDEKWLAHAGVSDDWLHQRVVQESGWSACSTEGTPVLIPWKLPRKTVEIELPSDILVGGYLRVFGWMSLTAAVTFLACIFVTRRLSAFAGVATADPLCLLPPAVGVGIGILLAYDPRIAAADVYRGVWVLAAILVVIVQWAVVALIARMPRRRAKTDVSIHSEPGVERRISSFGLGTNTNGAATAIMALLIVVGFCLRVDGVDDDPLHPDETTMYRAVEGIFECGFPRVRLHENLPPARIATSEAVYYGPALAELFFDDPRFVIRMPAVCFGTATICLLFIFGRHMFGPAGGLVAAGIYAFAPIPVAMTSFGRYFSQLQFFTLLTAYCYFRTIAGRGEIDLRWLRWTTVAFVAMFLSWEGSAIIVPGMLVAALVERRGRLQTMLANRAVWKSIAIVAVVVVLQQAHRQLHQAGSLFYGTGARDIALTPMWQFPQFEPLFYLWSVSWQHSALLPTLGWCAAVPLAVRHRWARPVRYLLIVFLANCACFSLLLPVQAVRYGYHLLPLVVLLSAASITVVARWWIRSAARRSAPQVWRLSARGLATATVVVCVAIAGGSIVHSDDLEILQVSAPELGELRVADQRAATNYLLQHIQEGDVVLAVSPHVVEHEWKLAAADASVARGCVNYWIESRLQLQPILDDVRTTTLHRLSGTPMISSVEELEALFARHRRIWYLTSPNFHGKLNNDSVTLFLRQHMDPVFEDYHTLVLLRDANHRPALQRLNGDDALQRARNPLLP